MTIARKVSFAVYGLAACGAVAVIADYIADIAQPEQPPLGAAAQKCESRLREDWPKLRDSAKGFDPIWYDDALKGLQDRDYRIAPLTRDFLIGFVGHNRAEEFKDCADYATNRLLNLQVKVIQPLPRWQVNLMRAAP